MTMCRFPLTLVLVMGWFSLIAQVQITMPDTDVRPTMTATQIEIVPVLDGNVLGDQLWQALDPLTDMTQTQPHAGSPMSENTEIRVAYTSSVFYVSVVCYDKNPEQLVISDARRDAALDDTDAFLFIVDTYHDRQNGFMFGTNPIGVEYDAQVDNEGQGNFNTNRQQGGMIGGFNLNWDGAWEVHTEVGDYGWSAEFAIPFKTLRFSSGENQVWGVNFRRNIRKTNEIGYWAPLPVQFDLKRLSLAGSIDGLNLRNPGNLKVIPYVLGDVSKEYETAEAKSEFDAEFGADLKYSVTPSLTLDLTYNTDFAQVEVDDVQINLDRFNLFFPEKRPFFLENAGFFAAGSPGEVDLFFSRRIGIGPEGQIVPIIGGARLSGAVNKTNLGVLTMFTEEVKEDTIQANNFSVARVNQIIGTRSAIGGLFTSRQGMSGLPDDENRTYAIDGKWGIGQKALISGFVSKTETPGITEEDHSYKLQGQYEWNRWSMRAAYTEVGAGFNPEMGFLFRGAFRKPEGFVMYRIRPNGWFGLLELRPHVSYRSYWRTNGFLETSFLHIDNHWEWESGLEIHTGVNFTTEGVTQPFEINPGTFVPAGSYDNAEAQIIFLTNASKPVYISTRHVIGGFFNGDRAANSGTLGVRIGDRFKTEVTVNRNDIRLETGDFSTTLFKNRITYSFTPRIYVQSLIQYNSVSDIWSANMRLHLLRDANTGLFLVYNEAKGGGIMDNRSFTVKYTHLFDVIK